MTKREAAAPTLNIAGWHDLLLEADLEAYAAQTHAQRRLVIGPWSHGAFQNVVGDVDFGFRANGAFMDGREDLTNLHLRWFDRRLRGMDNGIDDEAPVKIFIQGANTWRDEGAWPLSRARKTSFYLGANGDLAGAAPAESAALSYIFDPNDPAPTRGGSILLPAKYPRGPVDQPALLVRPDVLQFTSAPLNADLEIVGEITAILFAATPGPDTDWIVKLCDVRPDGATFNVTDGVLRARFRDDVRIPTLVTPNERTRYAIPLAPTAMRFKRGHRLRVLVSSSDFPRYDRNRNTGERPQSAIRFEPARQTIFCGGEFSSHLVLPVIPMV